MSETRNAVERGQSRYLGDEALAHLRGVRIGVAGAGGLGSNCAALLVRAGFRRLAIADPDTVDASNLNRQFFFADQIGRFKIEALADNLRAINPDLELELHRRRLDKDSALELFARCDAVVEAFDAPQDKAWLTEAILPTGKLLVAASGVAGCGNAESIACRTMRDNFYLVGDMKSGVCAELPPLGPGVMVAAAKQADVILNHFLLQRTDDAGGTSPGDGGSHDTP